MKKYKKIFSNYHNGINKEIIVRINNKKYKDKLTWISASIDENSIYIYLSFGNGGTIYFFLYNKKPIKRIYDRINNVKLQNFKFDDLKNKVFFIWNGEWEISEKTGKTIKTKKKISIEFLKDKDYLKFKSALLTVLIRKGSYFQPSYN